MDGKYSDLILKVNELKNTDYFSFSDIEKEFITDMCDRRIFPVFQPIANDEMYIVGFEILARWNKNHEIVNLNQSMSRVNSYYLWVFYFSFLFEVAIEKINEFKGKCFFVIKIPKCIAVNRCIINSLEGSIHKLKDHAWISCLSLEFEGAHLRETFFNLISLQRRGVKVLCNAFLPKPSDNDIDYKIRMDGYIVYPEIVSESLSDDYVLESIKSLISFANETNAVILVDGIDNKKLYTKMRDIGAQMFKGYFVCSPVAENLLGYIIRKFEIDGFLQ